MPDGPYRKGYPGGPRVLRPGPAPDELRAGAGTGGAPAMRAPAFDAVLDFPLGASGLRSHYSAEGSPPGSWTTPPRGGKGPRSSASSRTVRPMSNGPIPSRSARRGATSSAAASASSPAPRQRRRSGRPGARRCSSGSTSAKRT
jgi:hypothetical protein